jgi:hypothetical protein
MRHSVIIKINDIFIIELWPIILPMWSSDKPSMILVKIVINAAPIKIRVIYDFKYNDILNVWNNNNMSIYMKGNLGITARKNTIFREAPSLKWLPKGWMGIYLF